MLWRRGTETWSISAQQRAMWTDDSIVPREACDASPEYDRRDYPLL
jgi:hypothetical protein